ncbi:MAG: N-acetylmuramoyl-L-alanine amidase [Defluviitaleaceae bacterium]|nr:N-acetylmuramoyl-L-alanine amidase [Defluviitaleaceae bacterium]
MHHAGVSPSRAPNRRRAPRGRTLIWLFFRRHRYAPALLVYAALAVIIAAIVFIARGGPHDPAVQAFADVPEASASEAAPPPQQSSGDTAAGITCDGAAKRIVIDKSLLSETGGGSGLAEESDDINKVYTYKAPLNLAAPREWDDPWDGVRRVVADAGGLTIYTDRVMCFDAADNGDSFTVSEVPFPQKYKVVLVIDPGHGGSDPGAMSGSICEKDINLAIALKLLDLMKPEEQNGVKCLMTRYTDEDVSLEDRVSMGNAASFMISLHNNAFEGHPEVHGATTYFQTHDTDAPFTSKALAYIMQDSVVKATGANDRSIDYSEEYYVLNHTTVPTVIVEAGFVSNDAELALLLSPDYQEKVARGLYDGIMEAAGEFN